MTPSVAPAFDLSALRPYWPSIYFDEVVPLCVLLLMYVCVSWLSLFSVQLLVAVFVVVVIVVVIVAVTAIAAAK